MNFIGHSHIAKTFNGNVYVPSLSYVKVNSVKNFKFIPQALDTTLFFNQNGIISNAVIDQLIMEDSPYIINEHQIKSLSGTKCCNFKNSLEVDQYPSRGKIMIKK